MDRTSGSSGIGVFKYPVTMKSGSFGSYSVQTEWNTINTQFFITLDPEERYWFTGDGQSGSQVTDLIKVLEDGFHTLHSIDATDFKIRIDPSTQVMNVSGSASWQLKWSSSTVPSEWFGFAATNVGSVGGGIVSGTSPVAGTWQPQRLPSVDSFSKPEPQGTIVRSVTGKQTTYRFDASRMTRTLEFAKEPRYNVVKQFDPTFSGSLECFYEDAWSKGRLCRWYDRKDYVTSSQYVGVVPKEPTKLPWEQDTTRGLALYDVLFEMYEFEGDIE